MLSYLPGVAKFFRRKKGSVLFPAAVAACLWSPLVYAQTWNADLVIGHDSFTTPGFNNLDGDEFYAPSSSSVIAGGKWIVADSSNNRVLIYNSIPTTNGAAAAVVVGQPDFSSNASGRSSTRLNNPVGVHSDGTKLFVADYNNHRVLVYNSIPTNNNAAASIVIGQTSFTAGTAGTTQTKLYNPSGVFSDGAKLYIADNTNHRVLIFNSIPGTNGAPASIVLGQTNFAVRTAGVSQTNFNSPYSVAASGSKLFVADRNNSRILIYNAIPTTNNAPASVVVGQTNFTTGSTGLSQTRLKNPSGVWSDGTKLLIADQNNHRALIFNSIPTTNGAPASVVIGQTGFTTGTSGTSQTKFNSPAGIVSNGTKLFVTDRGNSRALIYDATPTTNGAPASVVVGHNTFTNGTANDTDALGFWRTGRSCIAAGKLLVADTSNNRVLIYNSIPSTNGAPANVVIGQTSLTSNTAGTSQTTLRAPAAVYSDGTKVFIADTGNHRVLIFNSIPTANGAAASLVVGQSSFTAGTAALSQTRMKAPNDLHVNAGKLIVADSSNHRVLIYNSIPAANGAAASLVVGQPNFTTGTSGLSSTKYNLPYGVHFDGAKLLVADKNNHRVLAYNSIPSTNGAPADVVLGQSNFTTGTSGVSSNKFNSPNRIFIPQGQQRIYVADTGNHRALVYGSIPVTNSAPANKVLGQTTFTSNTSGTSSSKFNSPNFVFTDAAKLYVSDSNNHRLLAGPIPNSAPVLNPVGNKTGSEGQPLQFTLSASDPDSDALAYMVTNLPSGAAFDPLTRTFFWTPHYAQQGSYLNVHFEVSDGLVTDSEDIMITILDVPQPVKLQDGYFLDPNTNGYWLAHGVAYQTWNRPLGVWQTYQQIDYDLDEMVKMHVNSIRVDFVWQHIEEAGDDQFSWANYDYLLNAAAQRGIKVFALIGYQWPPQWFPKSTADDPEAGWYTMHPPGYDNEGIYQPSRWRSDIMSFEDPDARAQYANFLRNVGLRYKDNTAIAAWIVGNEYGYLGLWSGKQDGYDKDCEAAFRSWLAGFYGNNIASLNQVWGTSYASFNEVVMPTPYNRDNPAWWDLVQWREDSVAGFTAAGAKAVRDADPNHLITYSTVGMQWGEEDWRYHAEDTGKIAKACRDIGAPLDFWSINNYPWDLLGSESQTGQWGVVNAKWRTGLPVMYSETGFTSSETLYPGLNEQNQGPLIRNSLWEALETGVIGIHVFTWQDRTYITDREKGFGITYGDRRIKPAFWTVRDTYNLMDQLNVLGLLAGSTDPAPDVAFYWSDATDQIYNRYEVNMQQLYGPLERIGLEPGFINRDELLTSKYFKDIFQADPALNLATVHGGIRAVKMNAGTSGGTLAVYPANPAQIQDLSGATVFSVWVYDTQGNNTIQLRLKDADGDGGSGNDGYFLWSTNASVQNQWTKINWNLTTYPSVPNLDKNKIASVELFESNQGVCYFDDATYTTGSEQSYQSFEKNNGTPRDYSSYQALILPRNMRMYPGDLSYIYNKVIPAGVHVYADADLPGMQDNHVAASPDFVSQVDNIFGINATNASGYDDPVENEEFGIHFMPITTTVSLALAPLTPGRQDTFRVWKYSDMTVSTSGNVYATHSNGNPALVLKNHAHAKAAITTFSLGDISPDGSGDGEPDIIPWAQHYDWLRAIFLSGLGVNPILHLDGSQYVSVDYRTATDGSILLSAKNYRNDTSETVTINTTLIQGRTLESLTSGGVIETNSDGIFNLTLGPDGHELIRAYGGSAAKKATILDAPAVVHPFGDKSYQVKVRYDTLGVPNLNLVVAFREDGDNGDGTPNEIYNSTSANVSGIGEQIFWLYIPDSNKADSDYKSTRDGGKYVVHAWLEEGGTSVSDSYHTTQLEWGANPITSFPISLNKGQSYSVDFEWEDLYGYLLWENTPLSRETAFPQRVAVVRSSKTQGQFPTHYDKANETCNWLESLGYSHSNPAHTHFDDVVVSGGASFSDNFDDGDANGWTQVEGCSNWRVHGSEYSIDRISQGYNISVAGSSTWTNYTVETKFNYVTQDPYFKEAYLIFRYQNSDNFYYVKTYDNFGLWRIKYGGRVGGQEFVGNLANIAELAQGTPHSLKIVANVGNFKVYLNGTYLGEFNDTRLTSGKIGLGTKASQLGVWEPTKGYYFVDDTERGDNGSPLDLDWGYLKEFFPVLMLPSVYVLNDNECFNIRSYLEAGQHVVLATDGGVGVKNPDGTSGTGRIESVFGVGSSYLTLSNLQNLQVTANNDYVTESYPVGQLIASAPSAAATAWSTVTTGKKLADIKNATSSAPALISKTTVKDDVSFQNLEAGNSTPGAYFYDAWQSNPAFETGIVQGGARSIKMAAGSGGGTIGLNLAAPSGFIDLTKITTFYAWVFDTQGNNTVQIKFKDKWGNTSSTVWSTIAAAQNQWTLVSWPVSASTVTGVDWARISAVELFEWNQGTYYFDTTYARTSDFGETKGKAYVFNFGVDTLNQMTNQFSLISARTLSWATREVYKFKIQLKYATPNTADGDLVLAEKDIWTIDGSGTASVPFNIPQSTMTGDNNLYWVVYAYPWDAVDSWLSHTGFYTSWNDPGYQSSLSGVGLFHAGATPLATGGRTYDNYIAYNTRGQPLTLNFGFKEDGDNGDGLSNEIYGGSPMFDGLIDPNNWLVETVPSWESNASAVGQRPQLLMAFKDMASASLPTVKLNFTQTGASNQVTIDKSPDRSTWTNIYASSTAAGTYNPTVNMDTAARYYRLTLNDGDAVADKITLQKGMTLTGYPSASALRLEDWLQSKSVNGILDDFRPPYVPEFPLVPDYDPTDTDLKNTTSGGKYSWVAWFTETSDFYEVPTKLSWVPRLKTEDPDFPKEFDPGTTVQVPVFWEDLDTIVGLTAWKPYAVTFPLTLRIFLQDVYLGVTYVTSDFIINTGSGDQTFGINVPSTTPYGGNYMWGAFIFDHKRPGIQPYEERIGLDDTFRFTPTGEPYEPETPITVGLAFSVYSDAGMPSNTNTFTWGTGSWDGNYTGETPPEGTKSFRTVSTSYAGWGVFKASGTYNLSTYAGGNLKFWVKSASTLKVEIEAPAGTTRTQLIASTGGVWQEVSIPINNFTGANLSQVWCPFKVTAEVPTTFYIDSVRWTH